MNEIISKVAEEYNVKPEDLEQYKSQISLEQLKASYGDNYLSYACQFLRSAAKRLVGSNTEEFYGVVLTASQPRETMARKINDAIAAYQKDPDEAVKLGVVGVGTIEGNKKYIEKLSPDGEIVKKEVKKFPESSRYIDEKYIVPLDNMKSWKSGKQNFRYLSALPPEGWFMTLGGIVYRDDVPKKFAMTFNSDANDFPDVPLCQPVKFRGNPKNETGNSIIIYPKKNITNFEVIEGIVSVDDVRRYRDIVPVSSLKEIHDSGDRNVAVEGIVEDIFGGVPTDEKPDPWTILNVADFENNTVKCMCRPGLPIDFSEGSGIIVFGQTAFSKANEQYGQLEDAINLFVDGIYTVMNLAPQDSPKDLTEEDLGIGEDF